MRTLAAPSASSRFRNGFARFTFWPKIDQPDRKALPGGLCDGDYRRGADMTPDETFLTCRAFSRAVRTRTERRAARPGAARSGDRCDLISAQLIASLDEACFVSGFALVDKPRHC
jgi:hypothetical protein